MLFFFARVRVYENLLYKKNYTQSPRNSNYGVAVLCPRIRVFVTIIYIQYNKDDTHEQRRVRDIPYFPYLRTVIKGYNIIYNI